MNTLLPTVFGIGLATIVGGVLGDRFGMLRGRWAPLLQVVGALMLTVILIGVWQTLHDEVIVVCMMALICGAELLGNQMERMGHIGSTKRLRSLLGVSVIALHHFPEGMAVGMSGSPAVCAAVVLHSIPEAMVIPPMLREAGYSRPWGFAATAISGAVEIMGVCAGAFYS